MSFWDEHSAAEAAHAVVERLPQNGPTECADCGHVGTDVLLGVCDACFEPWETAR